MPILNGKVVANSIIDNLTCRVKLLHSKNIIPGLGVIMVGDKVESRTYVNMKRKKCEKLGIYCDVKKFEEDISEADVKLQIEKFNENENIHGILVQLPLPDHINTNAILECVSYKKDVDGFHPMNAGKLSQRNNPLFVPCTPRGCLQILDYYGIDVKGKNVTVIGCSNLVGMPLSLLLVHRDATVTICHLLTKDTRSMVRNADIVFAACGCAHLVKADWVKEGVIVVDVGINKIDDASRKRGYKLVGDVDFENVKEKAAYITPVPGGVGPMTIAMLMTQVVESAEYFNEGNLKNEKVVMNVKLNEALVERT